MTDTTTTEDGDWLGYGVYADTLWQRIVRALDKNDLGDDPLVIGLFGEWGAGKSYLLNLIEKHAREHADIKIGWRKRDGGAKGYVLTVPVNFQPWKYEHEEHLLIPMLLHILQALEKDIKTGQTWAEAAGDKIPAAIKDHIGLFVKAFGVLLCGTAFALSSNVPIASKLGLAVAGLGAKIVGKKAKPVDKSQTVDFEYKADGRTYYEIHESLKGITRPNKFGKSVGISISEDIEVNFVVFIDDLDRCLPEQAVKTLEMIKTVFNIDSFAFVLALDDEVIERGIAHRYKDYALVDKKQQMPITGFEYLEKIVHLPFRLPQLTAKQARDFLVYEENRIAGDKKHWFTVIEMTRTVLTAEIQGAVIDAFIDTKEVGNLPKHSVLTELFIKSFDAYVPRKMVRVIELMHQVAAVATERGKPLLSPHSNFDDVKPELAGGRDVRVVFTLMLLQLFQPEFFRLLRRKEIAFPTLLAAFAGDKGGLNSTEVSEIDLWTWAVFLKPGELIAKEDKGAVNFRPSHSSEVIKLIGDYSQSRYLAQQIRLPVVEKLVEHIQVQRHVFSPIKLMSALAQSLGESAKTLQIDGYFSLLGEQMIAATTAYANMNLEPVTMGVSTFDRSNDIQSLVDAIIEPDTAGQANLASRLELPSLLESKKLSRESCEKLFEALKSWLTSSSTDGKAGHLLQGLSHISPWVDWYLGGKDLWALVSNEIETDVDQLGRLIKLAPALSRMKNAFWFKDSKTLDIVRAVLLNELSSIGLKPEYRARTGDALGMIGDPRFEGKYALPNRVKGDADEAPAGFVKIPAGTFVIGSNKDKDNPVQNLALQQPYYICRYPVTVAQYAVFVKAGGYTDQVLWESCHVDAWLWRKGDFDSSKIIKDEIYKKWLHSRNADLRGVPMYWVDQLANPNRPVTGVTWFEATVYAAWLENQRKTGKDKDLWGTLDDPNYRLRLPIEVEWERAALAGGVGEFPWGDNYFDVDQRANVGKKVGHATAVGSYPPNALGLHDMAGNVWEWQANSYTASLQNKQIVSRSSFQIGEDHRRSDRLPIRGGAWNLDSEDARCSFRRFYLPDTWLNSFGFRLVLSLADFES